MCSAAKFSLTIMRNYTIPQHSIACRLHYCIELESSRNNGLGSFPLYQH
jgi:hypothetical protein